MAYAVKYVMATVTVVLKEWSSGLMAVVGNLGFNKRLYWLINRSANIQSISHKTQHCKDKQNLDIMAHIQSIPISSITKETTRTEQLTVRVMRLWYKKSETKPNDVKGVELILIDENGDTIQASINQRLTCLFLEHLNKGSTYKIRRLSISSNRVGLDMATIHPCKIWFEYSTRVVPIPNADMPLSTHEFYTFNEVVFGSMPNRLYIDVIERLEHVYPIKDSHGKRRRTIVLRNNLNQNLCCSLFGDYVEQVSEIDQDFINKPKPTLVMLFVKRSVYEGEVSITSTWGATKILVNPDMNEVNVFNNSFPDDDKPVFGAPETAGHHPPILASANIKTLSEITNLTKGGTYVTMAKILELDTSGNSWYYYSCKKCRSKVKQGEDGLWYCDKKKVNNNCTMKGVGVPSPIPRFQVKFFVTYEAPDLVEFIIWDDVMAELLGKTAQAILDEDEIYTVVPPPYFRPLLDRKFVAKIRVTQLFNIEQKSNSYGVISLCDDPRTIAKWDAMNNARKEQAISTSTRDTSRTGRLNDVSHTPCHRSSRRTASEQIAITTPPSNVSNDPTLSYSNTLILTPNQLQARTTREKRQSRFSKKPAGNVHHDVSQNTVNFTPATSNVTKLICSPTDVVERLVRDLCAEYGEAFTEVNPSVNRIEKSPGSCVFNASYSHGESSRTQQNTSVPLNNDAWEGYWDCGDAEYECDKCHALIWFGERKDKRRGTRRPKFSLCCSNGKVELPFLQQPPEFIKSLTGQHRFSKHYRENIRAYNSMFSFTSMSGKIDHSINQGRGPYTFRMGGQNCHRIGTLVPTGDARPKFCQLYICDTEEEVHNRKNVIRRSSDGRTYNLPTVSEVAALIEGDIGPHMEKRDIIVRRSCGGLQRISELHPLYTLLQYPLLIPSGEDGYRPGILHSASSIGVSASDQPREETTCREWFAYHLIERPSDVEFPTILLSVVYTIEFQKRGLPHAHIVLFIHREDKFPTAADVDKIISAEIPDPTTDPVLYSVVCEYMLHGPCGNANPSSPCMVGDKCSKYYPKPCTKRTTVDGDGYPIHKRSKKGVTVIKDDVPLGNDFVILYNSQLLLKYRAHINVEWCNQSRSIKYLFKYINKGSDRVTKQSSYTRRNEEDPGRFDEIKRFYDCRYICACEAAWRIFGFDIHYRTPAVERLQYHLPDEQPIVFHDDDWVDEVVENTSHGVSQFLNWMGCNNSTVEEMQVAKELLYCEFPTKFVWKKKVRQWSLRKKGFTIGRLVHVPPQCGELYFMRVLLNHVKGPKCFEDIRSVNDFVHPTFREACYALGLIGDDREYIAAINEAADWGPGFYLRNLYAILLFCGTLSMPSRVWDETWQLLSDDILHRQRTVLNN
ncbi:uncharacterized protein LOC141655028 [Silene latifolia]|uniref:uncharacterized protein LOC141655028 n=1 Tax=Silene latifolia TaxID=37657 RepID=UPI003D781E4F